MLSSETKRLIDDARDYLVGVVPNPLNQIEQITFALIYKFMFDMDKASLKAGGKASFFTGSLKEYSWDKLIDSRLGNHEKFALYSEALEKFAEAKQLPELFRSIFKSAFLPYKAPETLGMFLKVLNKFDYNHPEDLGNAYEYLLSIMSSQGDAGQFRTPRHIIKFMVDVMDPKKNEKILDPACGTGGFLIYSYRHIVEQHDGKDDPKGKEKPLTPDDRKKLMQNLEGYDIDPSMVRMSQVNMYLHQFKNPQIFQYDTLTSEDRWSDKYDVILANPPFMSPRGGILPHNKFSVTSTRAEVLFVDYIINHLRPKGRAAIIVPEGIIFQSGSAYKALRKNLVENGLYAVVSLPSGVFNPYAGVKTSILFFDHELARQKSEIAFVKISADGYDLGATKRVVPQNDLPLALESLKTWSNGKSIENTIFTLVSKEKIAEKGDYNLSGDRYKVRIDHSNTKWSIIKLGLVAEVISGQSPEGKFYNEVAEGVAFYQGKTEFGDKYLGKPTKWTTQVTKIAEPGDILMSVRAPVGPVNISKERICIGRGLASIRTKSADQNYIYYLLHSMQDKIVGNGGAVFDSISRTQIEELEIPLPPPEVQEQIVAELDGYAAIISGAKQIVDNWKPRIDVDPEWPIVELGSCCQFINGDRSENYPTIRTQDISGIPFINAGNLAEGSVSLDGADFITEQQFAKISAGKIEINDVLFCLRGSLGKMALNTNISCGAIASSLIILRAIKQKIEPKFLYTLLASSVGQTQISGFQTGAAQPNLAAGNLKKFQVPLPSIKLQQGLIKEMDAELNNLESVKLLIASYERRTQAVIAKLWSE